MTIGPALIILVIRPEDRLAGEGEGAYDVEGGKFQ
jgi:hypothetical protein